MYPEELRYHEGHAWVRQDGDELTVGLTQYAVDEMGEIIFVELPEEGTEIERDEPYGSIESAKAVEDLVAPVSGEVVRRNDSVVMRITGNLFQITALGQALENGGEGDLIKVRNVDSKRVVVARVIHDGTVEPVCGER